MGVTEGACGESSQTLKKITYLGLCKNIHSLEFQEPLWSPSYEDLKVFSINNIHILDIFDNWLKKNVEKYGYKPRESTCHWVV